MQLTNKPANISTALAAATCALLGTPAAQADSLTQGWKIDTALMYYGETDRVKALEGIIQGTKDFGDEHIFSGKVTVDSLTGASPTGAVPQPTAQSFTGPSGQNSYVTIQGAIPLDDTFHDTRVQASGQWTQPIADDTRATGGISVSDEYDYNSISVNSSLAHDFYQKNTTVSLGLSYAHDTSKPLGGVHVGLTTVSNKLPMSEINNTAGLPASKTKDTTDVLLGVTQVINRRMLMQFNYGLSKVSGYTTDPYKVISQVNFNGVTQSLRYENRPDKRTRQNLYWQTKYATNFGVADVSYRYAWDDWKIHSHTVDSRLRINLSSRTYIQPHVRYYQQTAADFYQPFLYDGAYLPQYASADYRLGKMSTYTVGLKYGTTLRDGRELAFRLEYYQQNPTNAGFSEPGNLQVVDLYPSIKIVVAQVSYSF